MMNRYFTVSERNPGHWDITDGDKRCFVIRGEPGSVLVGDERQPTRVPREGRKFKTVGAAMAWIADEFMA